MDDGNDGDNDDNDGNNLKEELHHDCNYPCARRRTRGPCR
jgi:hypothetical protein